MPYRVYLTGLCAAHHRQVDDAIEELSDFVQTQQALLPRSTAGVAAGTSGFYSDGRLTDMPSG